MPEPTKAAMRAALAIARMVGDTLKESLESQGYVVTEITLSDPSPVAELIDREAGLPELIEALTNTLSSFRTLCWNHPDDVVANSVIAQAEGVLRKVNGDYGQET